MQLEALSNDPLKAIAISASGRENFSADADGSALGNGITGVDTRGAAFEVVSMGCEVAEPWTLSSSHLRGCMDPISRLQWWRKYRPGIVEEAKSYADWHGFLTPRLCGRIVSERSLAGRWLVHALKRKE